MIFLSFVFLFKKDSPWRNNQAQFILFDIDTVVQDTWKHKSNVDYLKYFKVEFFQFTFFGSLLLTGSKYAYGHNLGKLSDVMQREDFVKEDPTYHVFMNIMLMFVHVG